MERRVFQENSTSERPVVPIVGYRLRPGVHVRDQGITTFPKNVYYGVKPPNTAPYLPVTVERQKELRTQTEAYEFDFEPDTLEKPAADKHHSTAFSKQAQARFGLYDAGFKISDQTVPDPVVCTGAGYGKCPWCPKPNATAK